MKSKLVSSILEEGMLINTKIQSCSTWYKNCIYKVDNNIVSLSLLDIYIENLIMEGSELTLKYTTDYFEYLFQGTIVHITPEYPSYITINIQKCEELVNTRAFQRHDMYIPSHIKSEWDDKNYFAIITNISLGGMAFSSKQGFELGSNLSLSIYVSDNQIIHGEGKIIRKTYKDNLFDYSLQFTNMTEENTNVLSNYLAKNDERLESLKNKFQEEMNKIFKKHL